MKKIYSRATSLLLVTLIVCCIGLTSQGADKTLKKGKFQIHTVSPGLVMAGYQGWFNTPTDGANRGWHHFERAGRFEPGFCKFDLWPEMDEYEKQYDTPFRLADGSVAKVYSPYDESSVRLHFKWMKEYGVDGVFMQRFIAEVRNESGRAHFNKVLSSASKSALEYDRTISVMYDLSGMRSEDVTILINDWKDLMKQFGFNQRSRYANYLFDKGRPVVAVWGIGFNDNRRYNLEDAKKIINFLKSDEGGNCSILLGIPTYWREQGRDCVKDSNFLDVVKMADIVHPWFVGRFNEQGYDAFKPIIGLDQKWCDENQKNYMPVVFPGFSWNNMLPPGRPNSTIPRNHGSFFWKQLAGAAAEGARMIYIAMFDEIDEGTAIYKTVHSDKLPVGPSKFIPIDDDIPSDHYLWLTGQAANILKSDKKLPSTKPVQNVKK